MKSFKTGKFSFLFIVFLISMNSFAQQGSKKTYPGSSISDIGELAKQKDVLIQNFPGVFKKEEIDSIRLLDSEHSMIFYTRSNRHYEAVVNPHNDRLLLVATCAQISFEKLPAIVKDGFHTSKYGKMKTLNAFIVTTPYSSDFYRIDFYKKEKNGGSIESVFYDNMGQYKKPPY